MTVLVVGGGKMGMSHLALATQYIGKSNVALCDTKFSTRLLFRFLGYKTFASVDSAASGLDRLSGTLIATPTASHEALVRWTIEKKIPCFVEKPLTLNVKSSEELTALADAAGIPVQVGFVMRYVASFQRLRQLVSNQSLGKLLGYQASMRGNVITKQPASSSWQSDFARGGGCLNEYGPHIIDLVSFIFGSICEVGAVSVGRVYSILADDRICIDCIHDNATSGQIDIDWCDTTKRKSVIEFQVRFEYANVRVDNSAVEINWHDNVLLSPQARAHVDVPVQPQNVEYYLRGEEFSLELEEFLGVCVGRQLGIDESIADDTTPRLKDGFVVDKLIDEIARKGGLK
jgi:scyllo-inositol 2-dehydrogenase (NADP+)